MGHYGRECPKKGKGKSKGTGKDTGGKGEMGKTKGKGKGGPFTGCWRCGGSHYQSECPQQYTGVGKANNVSGAESEQEPQIGYAKALCTLTTHVPAPNFVHKNPFEPLQEEDEEKPTKGPEDKDLCENAKTVSVGLWGVRSLVPLVVRATPQ